MFTFTLIVVVGFALLSKWAHSFVKQHNIMHLLFPYTPASRKALLENAKLQRLQKRIA